MRTAPRHGRPILQPRQEDVGLEDEGFDGPVTMTRRKFRLAEEVTTIKYGVGYEFGPWDVGDNNLSTLTLTP